MTVEILLATYNGEKYIESMLESIKGQDYGDIALTIRDDRSSDKTVEKIIACLSNWDKPWRIVSASTANHGVINNFSSLMDIANPDCKYVMFADQDDEWLPYKVSLTLEKMKVMESQFGIECPLLVHSDLQVVDVDLKPISPSFFDYSKLNPSLITLNRMLMQNNVTGCAMMINRPLLELSSPVPLDAVMHDWWVALVASAFGQIGWIRDATIRYRQHGGNQVGAKRYHRTLNLVKNWESLKQVRRKLGTTFLQAKAFYLEYHDRLPVDKRCVVKAFVDIPSNSFLQKRVILLKYTFLKHQWLSNVALLTMI